MCAPGLDPITIASIAASAGGSLINANMRNDAISETNRQNQIATEMQAAARDDEITRQKALESQQAELVTKALFEAAPENVVEKAEAAAAEESPIVAAAEEYNVPTLTGQVENEDVNESIGATIRRALERSKGVLRNAALLEGQRDAFGNTGRALGQLGSDIQTIGSNRAGSSAVARYETSVPAATVTASGSPLGDLLMIGGSLGAGRGGFRTGQSGGVKPFEIGNIFATNRPLNAIPWLGGTT